MEHNDTDLFVIELTMTADELSYFTNIGYDESKAWLQKNWNEVTEEVNHHLDFTLSLMLGLDNETD